MNNAVKKINHNHNPLFRMKESKKFYITNSPNVEQALKMIELIHQNNTGFFGLFHKKDGRLYQLFMKEKPDFNTMMNYLHLEDLYLSINSFYIPKRQISYIRQINALWIDLDYYKIPKYKNKTCKEMIEIMRKDGMFKDLEPSFYVDSGKGMYIFYLIEDVPKQTKKLWTKIEKELVQRFKKYGADENAKDIARFLRLAGSENSKTGRIAELILPKKEIVRYKLSQIRDIILPELPFSKEEWLKLKAERRKKKKEYKEYQEKYKNNVRALYNPKSLNYKRMNDIKRLIELRDNDIGGIRNTAFHMYSLFSFYTYSTDEEEKVWNSLVELNNSLTEPISDYELKDIYNSSYRNAETYESVLKEYNSLNIKQSKTLYLRNHGCYIYTNQGIINKLNISSEEMDHLDTLFDKDEKNKRKRDEYKANKEEINRKKRIKYKEKLKKDGKLSRAEQNDEIRAKIKSLMVEGFTQKNISEQLHIGIATVKRHYRYIKENEF